ncbi:MAG: hypothetical protein JWM05_3493, partial [Acidimicrobiales bacterium]|nr:hypothetical protein [Acidimicrobiales bacterium]
MNRILRSKSLAAGLALTMAFTAAGCSKSKTTTTASGG